MMIWVLLVVSLIVFHLAGKRTFYVQGEVVVTGISHSELFAFVTNIANDHKWYMGIEQTVVIQEGAVNLVGRQYQQSGKFGGIPFDNRIQIMASKTDGDCYYISFIGTGQAVEYVAQYLFEPTSTGAKFTNLSTVRNLRLGYLFSTPTALWEKEKAQASLQTYTHESFERLLAALGKTGQVSVKVVQISW